MREQTSVKSILLLFAATISFAAGSTVSASKTKGVVIANSNAVDPAARQITRTVANETLKTISTKDSVSTDGLIVEPLEDSGPIVLPPKIVREAAPGTAVPATDREPAAEAPSAAPEAEAPSADAPLTLPEKPQQARVPPMATTAAPNGGVSADKAITWLQNGNKRYLKKANRTDGKSQADRARLTKGQHPHAIVLSCSDSRVPPETVFDQSLGEIFVVRTAGESLDLSVIASLEYAVEHLGPRLLVVMGHTSCGAIGAALAAKEGESAGSAALDALINDIKPRLPQRTPAEAASKSVEIESAANAKGVATDLLARSKIIRDRVEKGDLVIKPALYDLDSGSVKFY